MTRTPRLLAAAAMSATPLAALVIARLSWGADLPPTVASHWSGTAPDGFSDTSTYFYVVLAIAVASALLGAAAAIRTALAAALPIATTLSATFAAAWILSVGLTEQAGDPQQASLGWWILVPFAAMAWGLAVYAVLPPAASSAPAGAGTTLSRPLAATERAVWIGSTRSAWSLALAVLILAGAIVTALFGALLAAAVIALSALLISAISAVTLQIDRSGITLRSWGIGWKRIKLDRIESASAQTLKPSQWGGWGYRISTRGTAVILRGGEGLVAHLSTGRGFAISVDHAEDAARLLNSLIEERAAASS